MKTLEKNDGVSLSIIDQNGMYELWSDGSDYFGWPYRRLLRSEKYEEVLNEYGRVTDERISEMEKTSRMGWEGGIQERIRELTQQADDFDKSNYYTADDFCAFVTQQDGQINIQGNIYDTGEVLREFDAVAFDEAYINQLNDMTKYDFPEHQEIVDELEVLRQELEELEEFD